MQCVSDTSWLANTIETYIIYVLLIHDLLETNCIRQFNSSLRIMLMTYARLVRSFVFICVCVHVWNMCIPGCLCACMHVYVCVSHCLGVCVCVCVHACVHACVCVCVGGCAHLFVHACVCVCVHMCMWLFVHMCIYFTKFGYILDLLSLKPFWNWIYAYWPCSTNIQNN